MSSTVPIAIENLSFRYHSRTEPAIQNLDFTVQPGEVLLIAGASGCGKTTLARCINGLIPRSYHGEIGGSVLLYGREVASLSLVDVSQTVGTLLQDPERQIVSSNVYGVTFRQMGLPDKASFSADLAFRFVPTLGRDFNITVDAQRARGYELESVKGGLFDRLRKLAALIIPVTMQAVVNGEEVIDAMDLRAFGLHPRTWTRHLQYHTRDYLFIGLGLFILISAIVLSWTGNAKFWVPQAFLNLGH